MLLKQEDEGIKNAPWYVIDAKQSKDDIHSQIVKITNAIIEKSSSNPINRLWLD